MCLNHPDPKSLKTLDEVIAILAKPSCNTSNFINKVCQLAIDMGRVADSDLVKMLADAPESQLAPVWATRIRELTAL